MHVIHKENCKSLRNVPEKQSFKFQALFLLSRKSWRWSPQKRRSRRYRKHSWRTQTFLWAALNSSSSRSPPSVSCLLACTSGLSRWTMMYWRRSGDCTRFAGFTVYMYTAVVRSCSTHRLGKLVSVFFSFRKWQSPYRTWRRAWVSWRRTRHCALFCPHYSLSAISSMVQMWVMAVLAAFTPPPPPFSFLFEGLGRTKKERGNKGLKAHLQ